MNRIQFSSWWQPDGAPRRVLALAWPSVLEQSLLAMLALVDTYIVGHLGASAIAGVGLGTQILQLGNSLFVAVGVGATALIARQVGARNLEEASAFSRQAVVVGVSLGLILASIAFFFGRPLLQLLGGDAEVVQLGATWLRIVSPSFLFSGLLLTGGAILRGAGDMRPSLYAIGVANVINVVVSLGLTRGLFGLPQLGISGTAIGTWLGETVGGLIVLTILLRGRAGLKVDLRKLARVEWDRIRRILNVGVPAGAEQLLLQLALVNMAAIVTRFGTEAFAAHVVTLRLTGFSYLPGFGFSIAATTLVGQELGARRPERARAAVYAALALAMVTMSAAAVIIYFYDAAILGIFTNDPAVIAAGVPIMRLAAMAQPIIAMAFVFAGSLRGAGDTRATMVITALSVWGLRIVLAYLLGTLLGLGLVGVWLAFNADWLCRAILFSQRFRAGKWQSVRV